MQDASASRTPCTIPTSHVRGGDVLLVIEIADASLRYDLDTKVVIYSVHGVRGYWVINAITLTTMVHRKPAGKPTTPWTRLVRPTR